MYLNQNKNLVGQMSTVTFIETLSKSLKKKKKKKSEIYKRSDKYQ